MSKLKNIDSDPYFGGDAPTAEFIPQAGADFVVTPYIEDLSERALAYLNIGYAVHLSGPAGTGKSTLAMHIASLLGRHCTLLHGDDEFKASDLLGRDTGYRRNSVVDNYVSSIVKTEESMSVVWSSNRLTTACQKGHTLIYDEFTRSPAAANNPFLSILEEGILNLPSSGKEKGYITVHPDFRAIFTSNPEEYVGVHKTQDALLDRMITLSLDYQDRETEAAIVRAKSCRTQEEAETIVDIIRAIRKLLGGMNGPTVRAAIAIARIIDHRKCKVAADDKIFRVTCADVLHYHTSRHPANIICQKQVEKIIASLGKCTEDLQSVTFSNGASAETNSPEEKLLGSPSTFQSDSVALEPIPNVAMTKSDRAVTSEHDLLESDLLSTANELSRSIQPQVAALPSWKTQPPSPPVFPQSADPSIAGLSASHGTSAATGPAKTGSTPTLTSERNDSRYSSTASPLEMLEAAVSRFPRPPASPSSIRPSAQVLNSDSSQI